MKPEEAIAEIRESGLYGNQVHMKTLELALEALEKQVAKKPRIINGGTNICHDTDCCNDVFRWYSYCPVCGQAIDWGEEQ